MDILRDKNFVNLAITRAKRFKHRVLAVNMSVSLTKISSIFLLNYSSTKNLATLNNLFT